MVLMCLYIHRLWPDRRMWRQRPEQRFERTLCSGRLERCRFILIFGRDAGHSGTHPVNSLEKGL